MSTSLPRLCSTTRSRIFSKTTSEDNPSRKVASSTWKQTRAFSIAHIVAHNFGSWDICWSIATHARCETGAQSLLETLDPSAPIRRYCGSVIMRSATLKRVIWWEEWPLLRRDCRTPSVLQSDLHLRSIVYKWLPLLVPETALEDGSLWAVFGCIQSPIVKNSFKSNRHSKEHLRVIHRKRQQDDR